MNRAAGVLLSVSSLPAPYGIGTLGRCAYDFVDFLVESGQNYWQMLPVGPISYGDSPYQSFSTFAGNPYYIDLDMLQTDGLLTSEEVQAHSWGNDPERVDYGAIYRARYALLERAFDRGWSRERQAVEEFARRQPWLDGYARFMALKRRYDMKPWTQWPAGEVPAEELERDVQFFTYLQFLFDRQWTALKQYANEKGISIIGDLPIYVAMDSADVWTNPERFLLDRDNVPVDVSGVPPDGFTDAGQLWGNPLYRWDAMKRDGYAWWESRLRGALERFDGIRLDHFRGLESYWAVPYGDETAAGGRWEPGPGEDFIKMVHEKFPGALIIAEDLGYVTKEVKELLECSGYPGMKVLEFAFDSREAGDYLPHCYPENCVCYTGTHDNTTVLGWLEEADPEDVEMARRYLGLNREEGYNWGFLRGGMGSKARLFVAQMQDYLDLGGAARMNTPGTLGGNWQWRMKPGAASPELARRLREFTRLFGR
ncbi:MAG: 4-alpha-glucanotransferase [Oscillospiraceae bacterium]|nr:4-alpha-glucanotransferase [Oscillospiraceae bacterium]MCI9581237.1 4-alpha-glucanotransferase [Oscillospiraceae bacterium]